MRVGPALAWALRDGRDTYNGLAVEARLLGGGFAEDAFTDALTGPVNALATAVATHDPDRVGPVVDAAYRAALTLTGRGHQLVGDDPVAALWEVLAGAAPLVAGDPVRAIGSWTNATLAVAGQGGGDVGDWLARVEGLAGRADDLDGWLRAGRVAAWACGLAHHRAAALRAAAELDEATLAVAVTGRDQSLDGWTPDQRWAHPGHDAATTVPGRPAGDFAGLGGPFTALPSVWVDADGRPHASAHPDDGVWRVHADAFGTTLTRAAADTVPAGPGRIDDWPQPPGNGHVTTVAAARDTLVWTTATSYRLSVLGRLSGAAG